MVAPRATLALALVASGCLTELKPGSDREDAGRVVTADTGVRDVGTTDRGAPVDAPAVDLSQRSCPTPGERGCGMVMIPGGTFDMGSADPAIDALPIQPRITVGSFALDSHEVTVARFRRFWTVAVSLPPLTAVSYPAGPLTVTEGVEEPDLPRTDVPCNWSVGPGMLESHPINCVKWATAMAFCVWDGGRLPTEAEWEWAARWSPIGGLRPGRAYPWGDEDPSPTCDRARWNNRACPGDNGQATRVVGSFAPTPDVEGLRLYDLAGNAYEWVADSFVDYSHTERADSCWNAPPAGRTNPLCNFPANGLRAIRGSSWFYEDRRTLRGASRYGSGAAPSLYGLGFRCARHR